MNLDVKKMFANEVNNTALCFVHVPKAGGTTLREIMQRQYPSDTHFLMYGYDGAIERGVEMLRSMAPENQRHLRFLAGHVQFGLHRDLAHPCHYATMVREPLDRIQSLVRFIARDARHPLNEAARTENMSLREFVFEQQNIEFDNGQVRLLSGREKAHEFGRCPDSLLEDAKENIDAYFPVAGTVEQFDASLLLMAEHFGWRLTVYEPKMVATSFDKRASINTHDRETILELNRLDVELYRYVSKRLRKQIETNPGFDRKLRAFQRRNRMRTRFRKSKRYIRHCLQSRGRVFRS